MSSSHKYRILLADDQLLFVESLKCVLEERANDMIVVGIAKDGNEAVSLTIKLQPDVVLMDVRMPNMDGVQATRQIHELRPTTHIVMLTTFEDDDYVEVALKFGASGYLLKNIPPDELIDAVRAVQRGVTQMSPEVVKRLLVRGQPVERELPDTPAVVETLTRREREILHLLVNAFENNEIAEHLGIAEQTVKNYVHSIYEKLGVSNRVQLIKVFGMSSANEGQKTK